MLGKLIKYDFRSCWKRFWPIWLAILGTTLLSLPMMRAASSLKGGLLRFLAGLPFLALFVLFNMVIIISLVYVCRQFSTGLLGDPGYLMFTLPVKPWQLIASKAITALILELLCILVAVISGCVFLFLLTGEEVMSFFREMHRVLHAYKVPGMLWVIIAETMLLGLAFFLTFDLRIYASVSLGHLAKKNRTFFSVLAFILIGVALNAVRSFIMHIASNSDWSIHISSSDSWEEFFGMFNYIALVLGIVLLVKLLVGALYFLISHFILKRHLNLE